MKHCFLLGITLAALVMPAGCSQEPGPTEAVQQAAAPAKPDFELPPGEFTLSVFPAEITLRGKDDRQNVLVQAVDPDGVTRDVTKAVKLSLTSAGPTTLEGASLTAKANGETRLIAELSGRKAEAAVSVQGIEAARAVSFRLDVMPVFMKHGCNNGSCHGAARGKDGFMLSLFGYDPEGDYFRLTRQMIRRRACCSKK